MSLSPERFSEYLVAVHGMSPFPWQERLLREVLETGWPAALNLPTASGKTTIIDVATYALAAQAQLPAGSRVACRRIALVVDRRIVVDDAFRRAERIRDALATASGGILLEVADALRTLGGEVPMDAALMRGGIYREDRWARTPLQPVILCSTVDQVGSRLLHRGYGVSPKLWSIHAGLLGHDTLVILDEAHCSRPFLQTLGTVAALRRVATAPISGPFAVVAMTATPHGTDPPFVLDALDRANPVLQARLSAKKLLRPVVAAKKKDAGLVEALVSEVQHVLAPTGGLPVSTVLVVVNRVAVARAIRAQLQVQKGLQGADCVLLTGRVRPVDRDALLGRWRERLMAGRVPRTPDAARPLIVVATQCVEVGADLDVDALVTEACPIDSLRQRLGRLDRLGERQTSPVSVVCRNEDADGPEASASDPVYGAALSRTWAWLTGISGGTEGADLGVDALSGIPASAGAGAIAGRLPADLEHLSAPSADAPVLFPAYCDIWVQTGPPPASSPDPAIFLHGPRRSGAEVRVVWRSDLGDDPDDWAEAVALMPPVAGEGMPLPLHIARAWLSGERLDDQDGDVPSVEPETDVSGSEAGAARSALRWVGPDESAPVEPRDLRPGDVLVVPCSYGGCDAEGWNPAAVGVRDVADAAYKAARRGPILRLHPEILRAQGVPESLIQRVTAYAYDALPDTFTAELRALLTEIGAAAPAMIAITTEILSSPKRQFRWVNHPSGAGFVVSGARVSRDGREFSSEDDASSLARGPVTLHRHLRDVEGWARRIGDGAGIGPLLRDDLALAGRLHDLGKADPRFQTWLAGGDAVKARKNKQKFGLLAKSSGLPTTAVSSREAQRRSGYPRGARHELLSVRLMESLDAVMEPAHDRDLVMHLVGSHHGRCRPFAPVVDDPRPLLVSCETGAGEARASSDTGLEHIDSGVTERFWTLIARYGWWGLSYLEACLRLADHRASESPSTEDEP